MEKKKNAETLSDRNGIIEQHAVHTTSGKESGKGIGGPTAVEDRARRR